MYLKRLTHDLILFFTTDRLIRLALFLLAILLLMMCFGKRIVIQHKKDTRINTIKHSDPYDFLDFSGLEEPELDFSGVEF